MQNLSSLPAWYVSPTAFDSQNLYGVGEGYNLSESSRAALNNLAGKLMTSISSESSILLESNKYSTNEQSRQQINEKVAKITFNNYQISKSASYLGRIYVETSVDRAAFVADYQQKSDVLNKKMADIWQKSQNKTILEKFNDLRTINDLSLEAGSISLILGSLSANPNLQKDINLYGSYQNSYQDLASKMEFFIENENSPKSLVSKVVNILNQKNLKVVGRKNINNTNLVIIKINSQIVENEIYGSHIAKLKTDFKLLSNQNKIIKSTSFENTGSSVISKKEALSAAISGISDFNLF
ncbi:MAG: hypothetical protein ACJA0S_000979 [Rickettsiales bacterium]|jgi:hypothetical protein